MAKIAALKNLQSKEMVERWLSLRKSANFHVKQLNESTLNAKVIFGVDYQALHHVHISTYLDIVRYKQFHLPEPDTARSDAIKRAAYFTKWLLKFRPLFAQGDNRLINSTAQLQNDAVFLNEDFAYLVAESHLSMELGTQFPKILPLRYERLLYDFHFRNFPEDALLAMYQNLFDLAKGIEFFYPAASGK